MKAKEKIFEMLLLLAAGFSIIAVFMICLFLFANSIPAIHKIGFVEFIFGQKWKPGNELYGIFPMIIGSLYVTAGAIIFGVYELVIRTILVKKGNCPVNIK